MIPATRWIAYYGASPAGPAPYACDVVAWDNSGRALVADTSTGPLVPAAEPRNGLHFACLEQKAPPGRVIPGGGWVARLRYAHGERLEPVVAWELYANGNGGRPYIATPVGPLPLEAFEGVESTTFEHPDTAASTRA